MGNTKRLSCPICGGFGYYHVEDDFGNPEEEFCDYCDGTGFVRINIITLPVGKGEKCT